MDGRRWTLAIAGGVVLAVQAGCTLFRAAPTVPDQPPPPPSSSVKNSVYVPEPEDDGVMRDGPLLPSTQMLFAKAWVDGVAKDPNLPAAERDHRLSGARQIYQDILHRDPKNVDALLGLGDLYQVSGEMDKLREVQQKATTLHANNAKVWAWVAVRQGRDKHFDAAAESYRKAAKLDPENRMYRILLGCTLAHARRYGEGYECLSRCMREPEARYNLAGLMAHNGDVDRAKQELRLALKADPNFAAAAAKLTALSDGPNAPPVITNAGGPGPVQGMTEVRPAEFSELEPIKLGAPR
jgi:tetratricopeptide (TPR) repeat protein